MPLWGLWFVGVFEVIWVINLISLRLQPRIARWFFASARVFVEIGVFPEMWQTEKTHKLMVRPPSLILARDFIKKFGRYVLEQTWWFPRQWNSYNGVGVVLWPGYLLWSRREDLVQMASRRSQHMVAVYCDAVESYQKVHWWNLSFLKREVKNSGWFKSGSFSWQQLTARSLNKGRIFCQQPAGATDSIW